MANILTQNRIAYQIDGITIPASEQEVKRSNAPVKRVAWTCNNLPPGLTLSISGVLSGRPTTAGSYNCDINVATNWGTATKTVNIIVRE